MPDRITTGTGREFEYSKTAKDTIVFCRDNWINKNDIAHCAALAFHKSLIGISELSLVEDAGTPFRFAKAIQTYYPVYHLFVCNMLLDNDFEIRLGRGMLPERYEVEKSELNDKSELPEQWNKGRELEQDLASLIQHANIRRYCEKTRINPESLRPYASILYKAFVETDGDPKHKCIPGLFEKLEYIRDRAVYRPTHVVYKDGGTAQTSYDVRREIEGLPSSGDIYNTLLLFYEELRSLPKKSEIENLFLMYVKNDYIECKGKIAKRLGYSWNAIEQMGGNKAENTVPSFLCQMMELFDETESLRFYRNYWERILTIK